MIKRIKLIIQLEVLVRVWNWWLLMKGKLSPSSFWLEMIREVEDESPWNRYLFYRFTNPNKTLTDFINWNDQVNELIQHRELIKRCKTQISSLLKSLDIEAGVELGWIEDRQCIKVHLEEEIDVSYLPSRIDNIQIIYRVTGRALAY